MSPIPPLGHSTGRPHPHAFAVKEIVVAEDAKAQAPAKARTVSRIAARMESAVSTAARFEVDPLLSASSCVFSDAVMGERLPLEVYQRFKECVVTGDPTPADDQKVIAKVMFEWARELGAVDFAHWFFPIRGGGGAVGGQISALKMDTLIDLDWSSHSASKPFTACLPHERLFQGETDGSSFPNGGLRSTHVAAAFTTWDRSSPPFVLGGVLRIPCSFVTHLGRCIDDKTPLLRSFGALQQQGMRLLKALCLAPGARTLHSYLGWEQEFFVVPAEAYKRRPDLVSCGRTLIGKLPPRNQQAELNYFAPVPQRVDELLRRVQATMLEVGCPMSVRHNEVAPGQHEMSPIFSIANVSADTNVLFMEVCNQEAAKLGLQVLFHEKPFAGINGSGKHANWSIGTDTGINFFHPGKTEQTNALFVTAIACLAYGLSQHNELVRCAVAHAGNDHRLGAQEAPPAIISLYPGVGFEEHVESIIAGGPLVGYSTESKPQSTGSTASMPVKANAEDRNRTAPFPFCGNRFEFRAVGSSQHCAFPVMICNTVMASGMAHLTDLLQSGMCHRDAVAKIFKEHKHVIFTGDGYSKMWPFEAEGRGLPNLNTTPKALATWASPKNKRVLAAMGVYSEEETEARAEVMYDAYVTTLRVEVETMLHMVRTGIIPACARDMQKYRDFPRMAGRRQELYQSIITETDALEKLSRGTGGCTAAGGGGLHAEATYLCDVVREQMGKLRQLVDEAEGVLEAGLYPFPSYEALLYSHHH